MTGRTERTIGARQPASHFARRAKLRASRGIALVLVIFIVALATILVMNLTYSTYLGTRLESASARALQAEYLLKSTLGIARALIKEDTSPEDGIQDPTWGPFVNGKAVPNELMQMPEPNIQVELEIRPEEAKIPINSLLPNSVSGGPDVLWRNVLRRLFIALGFDSDQDPDHTTRFPDRVFSSEEMIANLIDYMDRDGESYVDPNGGFANGIEGDLPDGFFPNQQVKRIGELGNIPGFTPARVQKLMPFLTAFGSGRRINVNLAPRLVLKSLSDQLTDGNLNDIFEFRSSKQGPFTLYNKTTELSRILGDNLLAEINPYLDVEARWFQVLAKVDFGSSSFFLRAYLQEEQTGVLPLVRSIELF